jgi:hypothetical protein
MLAEVAEGRRPSADEAHVPTVDLPNAPTISGTYGPHGGPAPDPAAVTLDHPANHVPNHAPNHQAHQPTPPASPHQPPYGPAAGLRGRRRGRTIALVVVIAALVGGGGAAAMKYAGEWGQQSGAAPSSSPSASATPSPEEGKEAPSGGVPDNWVRVDDPRGFSLALPSKAWQRKEVDQFQVDYTPDGGKHFVRIAVDDSPDFPTSYEHLLDLEQQLQRLSDYQRVSLKENVYRDRPGARWDFTWTAMPKDGAFPGPRRAVEQMYLSRDGVEYAIYLSAPAADSTTCCRAGGPVRTERAEPEPTRTLPLESPSIAPCRPQRTVALRPPGLRRP